MAAQTEKSSVSLAPRPSPLAPIPLASQYEAVRRCTEWLGEPLAMEDYLIQSMPDASPVKWHLAHTSWFFETFVLIPHLAGYRPFHPQFNFLFNSYYNAVGPRWERSRRGLLSRPTLEEVFRYRAYVNDQMTRMFRPNRRDVLRRAAAVIMLGLNHEQQHQELIVTDLKHAFALNPLDPAYRPLLTEDRGQRTEDRGQRTEDRGQRTEDRKVECLSSVLCPLSSVPDEGSPPPLNWSAFPEGLAWIGHDGDGFAFDNETPCHRVFLQGFRLASRLVTNAEYLAFMDDGGYQRPDGWLADGWAARQAHGWQAPLYWDHRGGTWQVRTLAGWCPLPSHEPVCHVSYYEADAFARWAGSRLPVEAEWERAAATAGLAGHFLESGRFHPALRVASDDHGPLFQMFGDVWQWTASPYQGYPGYTPSTGALGEYNGKFMCNQMVLRGASCATPRRHARRTYRTFFLRMPAGNSAASAWPRIFPDGDLLQHSERVRSGAVHRAVRADVLRGLRVPAKELPVQYFYDEAGSRLFDRITELPEYYLTRTELAIMRRSAPEMAACLGPECLLLEYGSGSSIKTPWLLECLIEPTAYVPIDIAGDHLQRSAANLAARFPQLTVVPVCADFTQPLPLLRLEYQCRRRAVYFPGSTIGNFTPREAIQLLRQTARLVGPGGALLLGADLKKDPRRIDAAYNDSQGVTAAFNRNLLVRINRELGADFQVEQFWHHAFYHPGAGRIEMHLVSQRDQGVHLGPDPIAFREGESIRTEYSYKYSTADLRALAAESGFEVRQVWTDEHAYFIVQYLTVG